MADPVPLLQIIHVTDLHVQKGRGDRAGLAAKDRRLQSWLREQLEASDAFEWNEGTLGHDDTAAADFERFLVNFRARETVWFSGQEGGPETWLIDTGDASTNGDADSLRTAYELLDRWEAILRPCKVRSLFGNHDAWPGIHPAVAAAGGYDAAIAQQRGLLRQRGAWHTEQWLQPLATATVESLPRIECYGLNTVRFGRWDSIRAIGEIEENDLTELKQQIMNQGDHPAYRVLLTHHPVVFPYLAAERKAKALTDKMILRNAADVARQLLNAAPVVPTGTRSPYIHLMLSGHTHFGYPGAALPANVKDLYQGALGRTQAQLVGGSLMLLRARKAMAGAGPGPGSSARAGLPDFPGASVFDASQQFQILRFFHDASLPDGLQLQRIVMVRVPNHPRGYGLFKPLMSTTFVPYGDSM